MVAPARPMYRGLGTSDIALAVGVIVVVAMMIVPLPPLVLDMLLALNLCLAVTILMVTIYLAEPLQFAVFPSVLLMTTLFRLALNVSATRLILVDAHAGNVIQAFGTFVIGGNYVVGVVVFMILLVIQFIVITNGATRISEVAARFTLDAMPGKQMAIDADLNAGLIGEDEARRRRQSIQDEADFYGAMDGASKFVRGDAIAALVIVVVNIVGGFAIGVLQRGLPLGRALTTYTTLTIGEGLVAQIPALLISTAAAMIVTRATSESNLGREIARSVLRNPRALTIGGAVLLVLCLVPGMPTAPLVSVGGMAVIGSVVVGRAQAARRAAEQARKQATAAPKPEPKPAENIVELLQLNPLELEVGYGLIKLVDAAQGGHMLGRIAAVRRQVALELGIVLPTVRVRDNLQLKPNVYVLKLRGVEIARGELLPAYFLAIASGATRGELEGVETTDPAFGAPAVWITADQRDQAERLGYTVIDPRTVLTTHLTEAIRNAAPSILTRQDVQELITNLKKDHPALVEELIPSVLGVGDVQKVLQNLLRERVSVRDLVTILEGVSDAARTTRDPDVLTEHARRALARSLTQQHRDADGVIHAIMLSPQLEQTLAESVQQTEQGAMINLDPIRARQLLERLGGEVEKLAAAGHRPIVICSPKLRLALRRFTERSFGSLVVLSFAEVTSAARVQAAGVLSLEPEG